MQNKQTAVDKNKLFFFRSQRLSIFPDQEMENMVAVWIYLSYMSRPRDRCMLVVRYLTFIVGESNDYTRCKQ